MASEETSTGKNVPVVSAGKVKSVDEESMSSGHKSMNLVENVVQN